MGEESMRSYRYKALLTGAVLGASLSLQAMAAQEVVFQDEPCPLSVRETISDHLGTVTELSSFEALGVVNDEVLIIRYGEGSIGYVAWDEIEEKAPALAWEDRELLPSVSDFEDLQDGSAGDLVVEAQQALTDLGYAAGGVDGMYGPGTAGSAAAFQESAGLEATGVIDALTWFTLMEAASPSAGEALSLSYPPDVSRDGKYQMIIADVDDPEYLDQFLDPEWKVSYDVFSGEGRIDYTSEGLSLGTERTGGKQVDRVTLDTTAYVRLERGVRGAVSILPVIEVKAEAAHRPYVSGAVIEYGVFTEKLTMLSQECTLSDLNCLETTRLSLSPQVYKLTQAQIGGGDLLLKLQGLEENWEINLTPYLDEFTAFVEACYNVPLKDEEKALELTFEEDEEEQEEETDEEESSEEEQTESENANADVDTSAAAYDQAVDVLTPAETEISDSGAAAAQGQPSGDEYALDAEPQAAADDFSSDSSGSMSDIDDALAAGSQDAGVEE